MRLVIQRVKRCEVRVDDQVVGAIDQGLCCFLGVGVQDTQKDADYLCQKMIGLRIFEDKEGKMNLSLKDIDGALLVVSQFTLYGDCRKGRRPSFSLAAPSDQARKLYDYFVAQARKEGIKVATGLFQAHMEVHIVNNGPVTMLLDSQRLF